MIASPLEGVRKAILGCCVKMSHTQGSEEGALFARRDRGFTRCDGDYWKRSYRRHACSSLLSHKGEGGSV